MESTIMDNEVFLRFVKLEDCSDLWKWINDPQTRQASFSSDLIPWGDHQKWFDLKLKDPDCLFYMILHGPGMLPVGTVRYDRDGSDAIVSINIAPAQRRRYIGSRAIKLSTELIFRETSIQIVHACIKTNNHPSIKAFTNAGYQNSGAVIINGNDAYDYIKNRPL